MVRVAILPYYDQNPYQSRLIEPMRRQGCEVQTFPGTARWLAGVVAAKPDVVHFHWTHDLMLAPGWLKSRAKALAFRKQLKQLRQSGCGIVWTCHNLANHKGQHPAFERRHIHGLAHHFDRIIVHHDRAVDEVVRYFDLASLRDRFVVIPHAHYRDDYPTHTPRPEARQKLKLPDDDTVFLMFGQLRANKGIERLITTFRDFEPDNPRLRLLLAGSANAGFSAVLESAARGDPRIDLRLGYVDDDLVEPYHAAADVAVLPYSSGLTSGALILAMGFGLPIVCADCGDARRDIAHNGGVVLEDTSASTLGRALVQILEQENAWADMGQHNARVATEQSWTTMAEQTLACYRAAMQR